MSTPVWDDLEAWARSEIQGRLQQVLEEEVTTFQGRYPYQRRADVVRHPGIASGSNGGTANLWDVVKRTAVDVAQIVRKGMVSLGPTILHVFLMERAFSSGAKHTPTRRSEMFRVKPILSFVAVAALLVVVGVAGVDAGNLKGKKLLVDTVFNMMEAAEKVNEGVNTIAPSMSMAGDTVKVELFIDGGGGENIIAGGAKFADSDMEMMFDESWKIVAVDGIVPVLGAVGIKDDEFTLGGLTAVAIPDNGYFATVKILAQADIPDGASFYVKHAIIVTALFEQDSLDVSEAIVTVEAPKAPSTFSLSLDGDSAPGNQGVTTLDVTSGSVVPIQLFINDIRGANGISARFEYDAAQVGYVEFDRGGILPNAQVLEVADTNPTAIDISVVSFGGQATVDSGLLGSVRFRTTDGFSGTTLRLVSAELGRGDQREKLALSDTGVTLRLAQLTPDFNGDGMVDFGDFVAFGMHFGASRGDARYDAKYDLDEDGTIGFGDFLIFGRDFGT